MSDFWTAVLWNSASAALLGLFAFLVTRLRAVRLRPRIAHALWLLVFVKLVTPPLIPLPVLGQTAPVVEVERPQFEPQGNEPSIAAPAVPVLIPRQDSLHSDSINHFPTSFPKTSGAVPRPARLSWSVLALVIWATGTACLIGMVIRQLIGVHRLIRRTSAPSKQITLLAAEVASKLGIHAVPRIHVVDGLVAPMLCFNGRSCALILPRGVIEQLQPQQLECVIAHELAHYARRDHWTNLFGFGAAACFWWHPVAWLALRELRTAQEFCCDALVVSASQAGPRVYAESLMAVIDFLLTPPPPVPQLARGIGEARTIHRRFEMLASSRPDRRLPRIVRIAIATLILAIPCRPTSRAAEPTPANASAGWRGSERSAAPRISPDKVPAAKADAPTEPKPAPNATPPKLDLSPMREVSVKDFQSRYAFDLTIPDGEAVYVGLKESPPRRGYATGGFRLKKPGGGTTKVELVFSYLNKAKSEAANPLLSDVGEIQYEWTAPGTDSPQASSIFGVPLFKTATAEKKIVLVDPNSEMAQADMGGRRLLLIIPASANPTTRKEVEAIQPRGEIIAIPEKPQPAPQITAAEKLWRLMSCQMGNGVGTSYVKYRRLNQGAGTLKDLSPEQVRQIFEPGLESLTTEEAVKRLHQIMVDENMKLFEDPWQIDVFRSVGNKTFETSTRVEGKSDARYYDGVIDIEYDSANRAAKVFQAGQSNFYRTALRDFTLSDYLRGFGKNFDIKPASEGSLNVHSGSIDLLVDAETGFVRSWRESREGKTVPTLYQCDPQKYPGNLILPRLKMEFQFGSNELQGANVLLIDEARLNDAFTREDFSLELPADTGIFDYRNSTDQDRPAYEKLDRTISDAAAYLEKRDAGRNDSRN